MTTSPRLQPNARRPRGQLLPLLALPLVVATSTCTASADDSKPAPDSTLELGLRTGLGLGFGSVAGPYTEQTSSGAVEHQRTTLGDNVIALVPLWLDAGYRFTPHVFLGGYFAYAPVLSRHSDSGVCPADDSASCGGKQVRFGIDAIYHFRPERSFDPWLGLGAGYEILTLSSSLGGADASDSVGGPELLALQVGADARVSPRWAIGPFACFSLARYMTVSTRETDPSGAVMDSSRAITNKTIHAWIDLGVRGSYDFPH